MSEPFKTYNLKRNYIDRDADYVLYTDHLKALAEKDEEIAALKAQLRDAKDRVHVLQCAIDEVFNKTHLRNTSLLASNPPQSGGVYDLQNAVIQTMKSVEEEVKGWKRDFPED